MSSLFDPKHLGRWSLLLILVIHTLFLSGCARFKEWRYLPATKAEERSIHVVSHGWHTGIVLSRLDMVNYFGFLDGYLRESPYYEFGWGEEDFYQAETSTVSLALKALFWKNKTVMHVVAIPAVPEKHYNRNDIVELKVSKSGLDHLKRELRASFKFDENSRPYPLGKGLYGESRFFKAEGYYLFTNTCNRWTATMLQTAGVPMNTVFTARARSVISQAEEAKKRYFCCVPDTD
jgi:uncharacterized protein (TIGR02117 family)